ncbi:MAG: hypothetical protein NUV94_08045 [Candidatus Acetothermia bacterium]|nr:hypothetical protein [Candidatus Acetothermia bacterium]
MLAFVMGGVALAAPPSLLWEGKVVWTLPAATSTWSSTLALGWSVAGWEWKSKASFGDGVWKELTFSGSGSLGEIRLSPSLSFDPQAPGFRALTVPWKAEAFGVKSEGVVRLEERGFGWGVTFLGPSGSPLERIRLRFNLKQFLDEVLSDTFAPSFSFGEVRFAVALPCCVEQLRGWVSFTKAGFSELGVRFPLPLPRETGLTLFSVVRFSVDRKSVFLGPGFIYDLPPCVEAFLGLDWDPSTWTIHGIKVYAVGWHCQLGAVRVRGLTALEDIGLVKKPYREGLWVTWEGAGCCGPARLVAAAYFGDGGLLFGLGEVDLGLEVPLGGGIVLGLVVGDPGRGQS